MSLVVRSKKFIYSLYAEGDVQKLTCNAEKTGVPRALEALETNDWSQTGGDFGSDLDDFEAELGIGKDVDDDDGKGPELDPESLDFGFDRDDFAGLKQAIWNSGQENEENFLNGEPSKQTPKKDDDEDLDDDEIRKLERMMVKLQAVRDTSAGLPEEQRKRVAAKAVAEVMKEL